MQNYIIWTKRLSKFISIFQSIRGVQIALCWHTLMWWHNLNKGTVSEFLSLSLVLASFYSSIYSCHCLVLYAIKYYSYYFIDLKYVRKFHAFCIALKSRKNRPQKLTQLSSRSHPRHLVGKRTAQKDTIIDITSDSQVNSNFPTRWSPASLTFNNYFTYFYIYI